MLSLIFKILTFKTLLICSTGIVFAQVLTQEIHKSHLRWKLLSEKEQVKITKRSTKVIIQSLDIDFFEKLSGDVAKISKNKAYHSQFKFIEPKIMGNPYRLEISLKDNSIELFNFYKKNKNGYILDFWINQDIIAKKELGKTPSISKIKIAKLNTVKKKKRSLNKVSDVFNVKSNSTKSIIKPESITSKIHKGKYRDFRYGSVFLWDYAPLAPPLDNDINLGEKAPDYLYQVEDREHLDDKKEAHMQLNINFYRKEQWGLMTRSIHLYEQRYADDKNKQLNQFMQAVSMIKNTIKRKLSPKYESKIDGEGEIVPAENFSDRGVLSAARNILTDVMSSSRDYLMKKAIYRYLIQKSRDDEDYIQALSYSKSLYVDSSEQFDDEMIIFSSRVILHSLTHLKQLSKIKLFLKTKSVRRVLPKQEGLAYITYVNLLEDKTKQVLSSFRANQKSLLKPIHPSILFNTAEAYFRNAKYIEAIKLYDEFIDKYSQFTKTSHARMRMALSYDLLGYDYKKVERLYKDTINKSSDVTVRYEAKLRYVGLRVCRKKTLTDKDRESIAFIESSSLDKKKMSLNLKKLLWITRLRTLINTKDYEGALAYLTTLPIDNLRQMDQRTFRSDGAEIILGIIQTSYLREDYVRAVKVWEVYKEKYESKVSKNPYLNFIVSDSFIKLGLYDSYRRSVKDLLSLKIGEMRTFPLWVEPHKKVRLQDYIVELNLSKLLKKEQFKELGEYLRKNKNNKNINYKYYKGFVYYKLKRYDESVASFEAILAKPNDNNHLTPKENVQMLEAYMESLYESAVPRKFRKNVAALLNDLRRSQKTELKSLISRGEYLYLESLYSEKNIDFKLLSFKTKDFLMENSKTQYVGRVKYLRGVALLNTNKNRDGKNLLKELLDDKTVPEYLKGLARSELTALELNNRTL